MRSAEEIRAEIMERGRVPSEWIEELLADRERLCELLREAGGHWLGRSQLPAPALTIDGATRKRLVERIDAALNPEARDG